MDIVTNGKIFWLTMLCLFGFVALFAIGSVWMVLPIMFWIGMILLAIKFGWAVIEAD